MALIFLIYNLISSVACLVLIPYLYLKRRNKEDSLVWLRERFGLISSDKLVVLNSRAIWIHAVSVGEVMASLPLIKRIKRRYPERGLVLSTVTEAGNLLAQEKARESDSIIYLPFDMSFSVKKALKRIDPAIFVMIETEIWPNLLRTLSKKDIPSIVINGRISETSFKGYKKIRPFMREVFKDISAFGMQTSSDAERIKALGADTSKIGIIGNIKFDQPIPQGNPSIEEFKTLIEGKRLFVAGSTHEGEEEIILYVFEKIKKIHPDLLLLIAPRHIERVGKIEGLLKEKGITYRKKTELVGGVGEATVIILDTIGELAELYSIASVVFVGGSLVPVGGHNILEPAIHSKPILFGPYMGNFQDMAQIFLEKGAAIQVSDGNQIASELEFLLWDEEASREMGKMAFKVVEENRGAIERALWIIERFLP